MISEKGSAFRDNHGSELDITPKLAHKKDVHQRILKEKIASGKSKFEDSKNK